MTKLPDGHVLYAGGSGLTGTLEKIAEIYDPVTGVFTPTTGTMNVARAGHQAVLLPDGTVLIVGGAFSSGTVAELFNPATGTFSRTTGDLGLARDYGFTATWVPSIQKVLIAGGYYLGVVTASTELYDPATETFTPTQGAMTTERYYHSATLLPDGRVVVVGGVGADGNALSSAELWDPVTGVFTPTTGLLTGARFQHAAIGLSDGRVLVAGGTTPRNDSSAVAINTAEIYDPATGAFLPTASMNAPRMAPYAVPLPSEKVLVGFGPTAEVFDPVAGTFTPTGPLVIPHSWGNAVLLSTGRVLVAGGSSMPTTELFYPSGGYTLQGRILWNNTVPITSKTSLTPFFWASDQSTGQATSIVASFDPATSSYSVSDILPETIFLRVDFIRPESPFGGLPGDYQVNQCCIDLPAMTPAQRQNLTLNAGVFIRLRQPVDNATPCDVTARPTFTSPLTVQWDPVDDATQYDVVIYKYTASSGTVYAYQQTSGTSWTISLPSSAPGEHYQLGINAATSSSGVNLGFGICSGLQGYGPFSFLIQ